MPPKKKQQPKNALYWFADIEVRKQLREEGRPTVPVQELIAIAHPRFKLLSQQDQDRWKKIAEDEKKKLRKDKTNIFTSTGVSVAQIEKEVEEKNLQLKEMKNDISLTVSHLSSRDELLKENFYIIDFNIFLETEEKPPEYIPAELTVLEFSIEKGIDRFLHSFIDPGQIPLGYSFKAKENSDLTHRIPLKFQKAEKNFSSLTIKLRSFINSMEVKARYPPFYTMPSEMKKCHSILNRIYDGAFDKKPFPFKVYDLSFLLHTLREYAPRKEEAFLTMQLCEDILKSSTFDYTEGIACDWHKEQAKADDEFESSHCIKAKVTSKAYLLLENVCKFFNVQMVPNKHCPVISMESPCYAMAPSTVEGTDDGWSTASTASGRRKDQNQQRNISSREQYSRGSESSLQTYTDTSVNYSYSSLSGAERSANMLSSSDFTTTDVNSTNVFSSDSRPDTLISSASSVASDQTPDIRLPKTIPKSRGGGRVPAWGRGTPINDDTSSVASSADFPTLVNPPPGFPAAAGHGAGVGLSGLGGLLRGMGLGRGAPAEDVSISSTSTVGGRGRGIAAAVETSQPRTTAGRGRAIDEGFNYN